MNFKNYVARNNNAISKVNNKLYSLLFKNLFRTRRKHLSQYPDAFKMIRYTLYTFIYQQKITRQRQRKNSVSSFT